MVNHRSRIVLSTGTTQWTMFVVHCHMIDSMFCVFLFIYIYINLYVTNHIQCLEVQKSENCRFIPLTADIHQKKISIYAQYLNIPFSR